MRNQTFSWTTDAAGAATVGKGTSTAQSALYGKVYAVDYLPGTTDTGATITITCEGVITTTVHVKASAGTSNVRFYPRIVVNGNTDGAALTGTSGGDRAQPLLNGQIKIVIASGGDTKTGSAVIHYE
jgi:hypothetical protein